MKPLLFNCDKSKKRGRSIKTLKDNELEGKSGENFPWEALNKKTKDIVGPGRNHLKQAPASKS